VFVKCQFTNRVFAMVVLVMMAAVCYAESPGAQPAQLTSLVGTVLDVNNDTVPGATVVLEGSDPSDRRTVIANDNGFYSLNNIKPGITYHVMVSARGFEEWTSPATILEANQSKILTGCQLKLATVQTALTVYASDKIATEELAIQQVQVELNQRVFGFIPNFYVAYDSNFAPLTAKLKFKLAWKVSGDPVTIAGISFLSAIDQASDRPNYQQGWKGAGERVGANAANGFSSIMIGGAILPSLLHQDPRYFYKGTGTTKSRSLYAIAHPFVCKGDNGKWQPNYSSMGGDLTSSALSNAYYPASNRGAGLTLTNFAISTAGRMVTGVAQEFVFGRFTRKGKPSQ
jgi:hypothetical protein